MSKLPEIPEAELIARCLRQDRMAQYLLYERYHKAMYNSCLRILGDSDHAGDALQEAFIEVFRDLASFRSEATLGAWIKKIVIRKAILKVKREERFRDLSQVEMSETIHWPDGLTGAQIHQAIASLAEGYRAVFTLIEIEGYSHKEVAELMDISESTSKSQLFHAKKVLREKLKALHS